MNRIFLLIAFASAYLSVAHSSSDPYDEFRGLRVVDAYNNFDVGYRVIGAAAHWTDTFGHVNHRKYDSLDEVDVNLIGQVSLSLIKHRYDFIPTIVPAFKDGAFHWARRDGHASVAFIPETEAEMGRLNSFIGKIVLPDHFKYLLAREDFSHALRLTEDCYRSFDAVGSVTWLEQIREAATTKVETLARTIQALETIPDLQSEYRAQADSIINSFPEGHELRVHLQARFDAIVTAPRAPIPGEAQQGAIRGMADRLFG
jgi:hypothetical protein